jgi:hypothetical protein
MPRFRECARADAADVHAGWNHHRWIVDVEGDRIVFTPKLHWADLFDYLGEERRDAILRPENNYVGIHWKGSFDYVERSPKGPPVEAENLFRFYDEYDYTNAMPLHTSENAGHSGRSFEWGDQYTLPIELVESAHVSVLRFQKRLSELCPIQGSHDTARSSASGSEARVIVGCPEEGVARARYLPACQRTFSAEQ